MIQERTYSRKVSLLILVAALGYFVDIYDLILFLIVKKQSLLDLHIPEDKGATLLNIQMIGMLIGGIIWGVLGDKRGRLSTLFFTILLYSLANIANGFVQNLEQYEILRFVSGIGLAGELGIGITLVSEVMSKESRGYGTAIVSGVGIAGAALGFLITHFFGWREAYFVGGGLGLALLVMRISVNESSMFDKAKKHNAKRGSFISLFTNKKRALKYLYCILIGVPVWFVIGILIKDADKFGSNVFHVKGVVEGGQSVMWHYMGASVGSFLTGFISQWLRSRKKALYISLVALCITVAIFFSCYGVSNTVFYVVLFVLGVAQGYWAVFVTIASEQFGTNMRATVATTVPNIVRGLTVLMSIGYVSIGSATNGSWTGAAVVGGIVLVLAFFSASKLDETYGKDLDYLEPAE
ncbi:MAG: MFS transporter [Bacteroidetes bacterium]|jgi:MFS family permease|nr:MFS transporter [Bacteroidota bacterium]